MILSAAIRYREQIYRGKEHILIYADMLNCLGFVKLSECEYGFVTDKNEFVDRVTAARIAFEAGQMPYDTGYLTTDDLLMSKKTGVIK